jgi:hypothetical protein
MASPKTAATSPGSGGFGAYNVPDAFTGNVMLQLFGNSSGDIPWVHHDQPCIGSIVGADRIP